MISILFLVITQAGIEQFKTIPQACEQAAHAGHNKIFEQDFTAERALGCCEQKFENTAWVSSCKASPADWGCEAVVPRLTPLTCELQPQYRAVKQ